MEKKGICKAVAIIARIFEVFCWVGVAFSAVITAVTVIGRQDLYTFLMTADSTASSINIVGFEVASAGATALTPGAFTVAFIAAIFIFGLMAMIARNVCLIFKTAIGESRHAEGSTPFQPGNIRRVRQIGILAIAIPVVGVVMQFVAGIALGFSTIECGVDFNGVFFGLVALALAQFFSYGVKLQGEVDGLV